MQEVDKVVADKVAVEVAVTVFEDPDVDHKQSPIILSVVTRNTQYMSGHTKSLDSVYHTPTHQEVSPR